MAVLAGSGCIRITDACDASTNSCQVEIKIQATRRWCFPVSSSEQVGDVGRCMLISLTAGQPSLYLPPSCISQYARSCVCASTGPTAVCVAYCTAFSGLRKSTGEDHCFSHV